MGCGDGRGLTMVMEMTNRVCVKRCARAGLLFAGLSSSDDVDGTAAGPVSAAAVLGDRQPVE